MDNWYLLQTKPRDEQRACENLHRQGVEVYLPEITVEKVVRGKRKSTVVPLFPGYVFVLIPAELSHTSVRSTRGVTRFVSFGGEPSVVDAQLIVALKAGLEVAQSRVISDLPAKGEQVEILDGPFRGLNGVFSQLDGEARAMILVDFMSTQVSASVPLAGGFRRVASS